MFSDFKMQAASYTSSSGDCVLSVVRDENTWIRHKNSKTETIIYWAQLLVIL